MGDTTRAPRIAAVFVLSVLSFAAPAVLHDSAAHWILPTDGLAFAVIGFKLLRGDESPTYAKQKLNDLVTFNVYACVAIALFFLAKRYGDVPLPDWALAISCMVVVVLAATVIRRGYRAIQT